jgi:hypothetical protein
MLSLLFYISMMLFDHIRVTTVHKTQTKQWSFSDVANFSKAMTLRSVMHEVRAE